MPEEPQNSTDPQKEMPKPGVLTRMLQGIANLPSYIKHYITEECPKAFKDEEGKYTRESKIDGIIKVAKVVTKAAYMGLAFIPVVGIAFSVPNALRMGWNSSDPEEGEKRSWIKTALYITAHVVAAVVTSFIPGTGGLPALAYESKQVLENANKHYQETNNQKQSITPNGVSDIITNEVGKERSQEVSSPSNTKQTETKAETAEKKPSMDQRDNGFYKKIVPEVQTMQWYKKPGEAVQKTETPSTTQTTAEPPSVAQPAPKPPRPAGPVPADLKARQETAGQAREAAAISSSQGGRLAPPIPARPSQEVPTLSAPSSPKPEYPAHFSRPLPLSPGIIGKSGGGQNR